MDPTDEQHAGEGMPTIEREVTSRRPRILGILRVVLVPAALAYCIWLVSSNRGELDVFVYSLAAAAMLGFLVLVTVLWALSLRYERLRRALIPLEGAVVAAAIILGVGQRSYEVDTTSDQAAVAFMFGMGCALLLAFLHPLVDGRRRSGAWLVGAVGVVAALGIALPAALEWADGQDEGDWYAVEQQFVYSSTLGRISEQGVVLGTTGAGYTTPTLSSGHQSELDMYGEVAYPVETTVVSTGPLLQPTSESEVVPSAVLPNDVAWARAVARADGTIDVHVEARMVDVDGPVFAAVRAGSCSGSPAGDPVMDWKIVPGASGTLRRTLPSRVGELRVDAQLSIVIGQVEPLAPTRCIELLDARGVALAQLGGAAFHERCIEPLTIDPTDVTQLQPSSFDDARCAAELERLASPTSGVIVVRPAVAGHRACLEDAGIEATEHELPGGSVVFGRVEPITIDDPMLGCPGTTADTSTDPAVAIPVLTPSPVIGGVGSGLTLEPVPPGTPGAVPGDAVLDDLNGETPADVAEKIR
jgi:hypothetical protein